MKAQALRVEEAPAPYRVAPLLTNHLNTFASAPEGFKRLRELVLNLAVRGRLVPQEPKDEPADKLLTQIQAVRNNERNLSPIADDTLPFSVPSGWRWVRLGAVCSYIQRGKSPAYSDHSEFPVVSQKCVRWHGLDLSQARFIQRDSIGSYEPVRFLRPGDLLWNSTGTGTIGRAVVVPASLVSTRIVADSHVTVVRPLLFSSAFLWRWIQSPFVQCEIEGMASGTTKQIELNTSTVIEHLFPLPPLAEQSRIVAKVEELMALIDALEAKVGAGETARGKLLDALLVVLADSPDAAATAEAWAQLAPHFDLLLQTPADVDRLQQTLLQLAVKGRLVPQNPNDEPAAELFKRISAEKDRLVAEGKAKREKLLPAIEENGAPYVLPRNWRWVRTGSVSDVAGGIQKTPARAPKLNHHPYLRVANVQRGRLVLDEIEHFELLSGELEKWRLEPNDILVVEGNGSEREIGRCALWHGEIVDCVHQNHLIRIRPLVEAIAEFVLLYLNSEYGRSEMKRLAITTSGLFTLSVGKIETIALPLPPLPEQSRIVAAVASLTALCDRLRERLAARRALSAKLAVALTEAALA